MATLSIRFPGCRYHATPWGSHVNEGVVEWPPSPWRILRALLAVGYEKVGWRGERPPDDAAQVIEMLAGVLPSYRLPQAAAAHSRHYMPLARFKDGREETALVIDTWAHIDDDALLVRWPIELSASAARVLAELVDALGHLGRSESWVEAELLPSDPPAEECPIVASDGPSPHRPGWEQVPLLAPVASESYRTWREAAVSDAMASAGLDTSGRMKKVDRRRVDEIEGQYPAEIVACLQAETSWLRAVGWNQPPGSRRVLYWRPRAALDLAPMRPHVQRQAPPVQCMLLSLMPASGSDRALPHVSRVLPQAELLHRALVSMSSRIDEHSVVLSGCDMTGKPLRLPHQHSHLLYLDLDDDNHLDHVLIWAPMGLDAPAQAAVRAVRRTFTKGGVAPLRMALVAAGGFDALASIHPALGARLRRLAPQGGASVWRSVTPFVPPRHLKKSGRNSLEGQIAAELSSRGLPVPARIEVILPAAHDDARRARHVIRRRRIGPQPPADVAFLLQLEFDEPVQGPIVIGYGSHLGLGLCAAVLEAG